MSRMREILEGDAVGSVAMIYNEIRDYYRAPYVSSLFRHLATYPGLLEWMWKLLGPHLKSGLFLDLTHLSLNKYNVI